MIWPPIKDLVKQGKSTHLRTEKLPRWAEPEQREENYHHAIRRLLETSDWPTLSVWGPEVEVGGRRIDIVVDTSLPDQAEFQLADRIGIEVKTAVDAFETNNSNLTQIIDQAKTGKIDRLYVCTPDTGRDEDTRLDINPELSQLANQLEFSQSSIAFRGLTGTVQNSPTTEISKPAYYTKLLYRDKEKVIKELKRRGDFETVKQNLQNNDAASLDGYSFTKRNNWIDPILQKIGILRFDVETGKLRVQKEASYLDRSSEWAARNEVTESDVVHAVWSHYIEHTDVGVAVEVEPPSLVSRNDPDMVERFFGTTATRRAPRIDVLINTGDSTRGIEVKGPDPDWERLLNEQVPTYLQAAELDELDIAVPKEITKEAKSKLQSEYPSVGLVKCSYPRGDAQIQRVL